MRNVLNHEGHAGLLIFGMMVKYNGPDELHPGDILALDGNNATVNDNSVLGTVKATAQNAGAAIGVAQYRYNLYSGMSNTGMRYVEQADTEATSFHQGDLIQLVVMGQAQVKVSGPVSIGDRLAITQNGLTATKSSEDSIGKVAEKPDSNGMVTIFVNFK